jgi:hypothetical protein
LSRNPQPCSGGPVSEERSPLWAQWSLLYWARERFF